MPHTIVSLQNKAVVAHSKTLFLIDEHKILAQFEVPAGHIDNILVSPDQSRILGVNHEDKSVVVFDTQLKEQTRFAFPKRPSSLAFKSETQVLVADKFGDVYDLDLNGTATDEKGEFSFLPVLGHVSMLLKIAVVGERILTADRDEHIKVSNLAKPYEIEGFCFGHTQYVADLCIVGGSLLSAGGDSFVAKWDLNTCEETGRLDLSSVFPDLTQFNVLRLVKFDDMHAVCVIQESPVLLKINVETMEVAEQYALPDQPVDATVSYPNVWAVTKDSVFITDLKETKAFPETFGQSEVRILMQHEMRKRAEH